VLGITSLFTLLGIVVDRLLAISRPLFYQAQITPERINLVRGSLIVALRALHRGLAVSLHRQLRVTPEQMVHRKLHRD
jgi:hypothetical protein